MGSLDLHIFNILLPSQLEPHSSTFPFALDNLILETHVLTFINEHDLILRRIKKDQTIETTKGI